MSHPSNQIETETDIEELLTPEELDKQLDNFESIIEMLENPLSHAISEEDLELLNEISMKLNSLPDMNSFHMENKHESKSSRRAQTLQSMGFGSGIRTSNFNEPNLKNSLLNCEVDHLEASQFDPNSTHNGDESKAATPRTLDYREELKSKGMTLDLERSEVEEESTEFNPELLI
jgi:hypothetical protein